MPGTLRSVTSTEARKRRRGESDEDYAKRIARLEQKRRSQLRSRNEKPSDGSVSEATSNQRSSDVPPPAPVQAPSSVVFERILEAHNADLAKAERQVADLVRLLERERNERAKIEARMAEVERTLNARNRVVHSSLPVQPDNVTEDFEIIDLSEQGGHVHDETEIIDVFGDGGQADQIVSTIADNQLISYDISSDRGQAGGDPASPLSSPLKGVSLGGCRANDVAFPASVAVGEAKRSEAEQKKNSASQLAEMALWVGWLDRSRRDMPAAPLYVRFGPHEQRAWRDLLVGVAEFVGSADTLDEPSGELPFALELAWTLRYALDSLPPAAPVLDVVWRFVSGFMKPQPRARLGVLAVAEDPVRLVDAFASVELELAVGSLVIDRSARP